MISVSPERKAKAFKLVRNITLSFLALLVIVIGLGVAYTWYVGQQSEKKVSDFVAPTPASERSPKAPLQQAPDAVMSASVQSFTSPVIRGSNASIMVKTNSKASCTILVEYNKVPSTDSGLTPKTADAYGIVQWAWTVPDVPLGTWPVTVTCANKAHSAVVKGDLKVVESLEGSDR